VNPLGSRIGPQGVDLLNVLHQPANGDSCWEESGVKAGAMKVPQFGNSKCLVDGDSLREATYPEMPRVLPCRWCELFSCRNGLEQ
jgi:hypothetical protein